MYKLKDIGIRKKKQQKTKLDSIIFNMENNKIKKVSTKSPQESRKSIVPLQKTGNKQLVPNHHNTSNHPILSKIIVRVITIVVIALILFITTFCTIQKISKAKTESKAALISMQLTYCQELTTMKYMYSDVISLKKASLLARSYSLVKYSGVIRAGIRNVADIEFHTNLDNNSILLYIPQAELLGNEITDQKVFDEKQSIFKPITTQEIFNEIDKAKESLAEQLVEDGLLEDARNYAISIITQFMYGCGFDKVIIKDC